MVLSWRTYFLLLFVFCMNLMDMTESCEEDEQCKPHQVCCGKRCRSWPKCFLNSDKECYYDTHCVHGAFCVSNVCKPKRVAPSSCRKHDDCVFHKSYDGMFNTSKCCSGRCYKTQSCLALEINTTVTTIPTTFRSIPGEACWTNGNCPSGFECVNAECTVRKPVDAPRKTDDTTLSRAGFLSAAILTSAVFLTVMCFCFLKETKYVRRHMERSQVRESLTQSTTAQPITVHQEDTTRRNNNRALNSSWMSFPALYGFTQTERTHGERDSNCEHQEDCNSTCTGPPSYRSVCFEHELPPSYDEVMNYRCESQTCNAARTNSLTISCYA